MSVVESVAPTATRLTTVQAVLDETGAAVADAPVIQRLIDAASAAIARDCSRVWGRSTVVETLAGTGGAYLGLSRIPLVSVASVTEDGGTLTDWSIADTDAGSLYREAGWGRGSGGWDTIAYTSGYLTRTSIGLAYVVTYTAGYYLPEQQLNNLPADVERACLETVKSWYAARAGRDSLVTSRAVGDVRVTYADARSAVGPAIALPPVAVALLANYKRPLGP